MANLRNQGFLVIKGVQQESAGGQFVVKEYKLSCVVLKVKVKKSKGRVSAEPSKLAAILSLKRVCKRFSLLEKRAKYWQF